MKTTASRMAFVGLAVLAFVSSAQLLSADGPKVNPGLPEGFSGEYVLIQHRDGELTILRKPQVKLLGVQSYLVGQSHHLEDVTNDALFEPTIQWVSMAEIRRIGEMQSSSSLSEVRERAFQIRARAEKVAADRKQ